MTNPLFDHLNRLNRRELFGNAASGVGLAALAKLMGSGEAFGADGDAITQRGFPGLPGLPHFPPKAKRVVVLWQGGGPSHVDLFDDKPKMREMVGQNIPDSIRGTTRLSTMSSGYGKWPCLPAIKPHRSYGQSGIVMSEMLPNVGAIADDICLVRSMHTEGPSAALVRDLKERGMLDDTLVVWGGEFGRTPFGQGDPVSPKGRDHFGKAYSWWLAGGGVKPGTVYGSTDDFGWNITADPVHVHDMQATILHLCGIDHTRLTFRYQGRQYRITDVHGEVVKGIVA